MQLAEIEADLELIVSNAQKFNRPHDPVFKFATELQGVFRSQLPAIRRALEGMGAGGGADMQVDKRARR